jgi:hypothetical protein
MKSEKLNMKLRVRCERDLKKMINGHKAGHITSGELLDAQWHYYENWVVPITFFTNYGPPIILN